MLPTLVSIVLLAFSRANSQFEASNVLKVSLVSLFCTSTKTSRPTSQSEQATSALEVSVGSDANQLGDGLRSDIKDAKVADLKQADVHRPPAPMSHTPAPLAPLLQTPEADAQWRASATLGLLKALRPCTRCRSYARYGAETDGGYIMCQDALQGIRAAYSFGIGRDDEWGKDVAQRLGVPVFEFDCFRKQGASCKEADRCDLRFRPECLGTEPWGNDTLVYRSLHDHLRQNLPPGYEWLHFTQGGDLLLKADIEGNEWSAFSDARRQDLKRLRQLVVEFHMLSRVDFHEFYLKALRKILKAGFVVAHIHGNNFAPMAVFADGSYQVPDVLEVTFVNKLAMPNGTVIDCASQQDVLTLDAPNNLWYPELPTAYFPKDDAELAVGSSRITTVPVIQCRFFCWLMAFLMGMGPVSWAAMSLLIMLVGYIFFTMVKFDSGKVQEPANKRRIAWRFRRDDPHKSRSTTNRSAESW